MSRPNRVVRPVHFEDFDGKDFERLVFALALRSGRWRSLEWYGEVGADLGRDIWGEKEENGETVCIQCANWKRLTAEKAKADIRKILKAPRGAPDILVIAAGGTVSATARDAIKGYAAAQGIEQCHVWSGVDLEERIRFYAESLLRRFCDGEQFPDDPKAIESFSRGVACPLCDPARAEAVERVRVLERGKRSDLATKAFYAKRDAIRRDFANRGLSGSGGQLAQIIDAKREATQKGLEGLVAAGTELAEGCCDEHRNSVLQRTEEDVRASCRAALDSSASWIRDHMRRAHLGDGAASSAVASERSKIAGMERFTLRDLELAELHMRSSRE